MISALRRWALSVALALAVLFAAAAIVLIAVQENVTTACVFLIVAGGLGLGSIAALARRSNHALTRVESAVRRELNAIDAFGSAVRDAALTTSELQASTDAAFIAIRELLQELSLQLQKSDEQWTSVDSRLAGGKFGLEEVTRRLVTRDVSALLNLHDLVTVHADPIATTGWVATPETLLSLVSLVDALPDGAVIVEAGSGLSTIWLALAVEKSGRRISIISLEHDADYGHATRQALARQGLTAVADVRFAPLGINMVGGEELRWYDPSIVDTIDRVDLLFVDGPPRATGDASRYPAVPILERAFVDGAVVIFDDTDRPDEKSILGRWLNRSSEIGGLSVERELDRATLLRYRRTTS